MLGTLQASLTDFRYLSSKWVDNTKEEALLGVSLTGIMDHHVMSGDGGVGFTTGEERLAQWLRSMRDVAVETNKEFAPKLGVNVSAAITCVKPSGTVSQLVDSASGIHPRHSKFYIRRVRGDNKDPLTQMLKDMGVPYGVVNNSTVAFEFPIKAPDNCITRHNVTAIEQLELWKIYQENWCEHKPSITVYYKDDEYLDVVAWIYKHFDDVSGISLLPKDEGIYPLMPYEDIDEETFTKLSFELPAIDWSKLKEYETEDMTVANKELACSAGVCEI